MKRLLPLLLALALLPAGCGGDDDKGSETKPAQSAPAKPAAPGQAPQDEGAVRDTIITWMFEGDCDLMTDRFLEEQTLGIGDTRQERCDLFEKQHQKPQYSEDDVKISDIRFNGTKSSAVVGSEGIDVSSKYSLVYQGGRWRIDAADIQ